MRFIEHCSDVDLVRELVRRAKAAGRLTAAPDKTTRHVPHRSVLIGIDPDNTADLILDDEAVDVLLNEEK